MAGKPYRNDMVKFLPHQLQVQSSQHHKVSVCGTVIGKRITKPYTMLKLDDGTGVINCIHFKNNDETISKHQLEEINKEDGDFLSCFQEIDTQKLKYGDLIRVYGVLKIYNGEIQVTVHFLSIIEDPNTETQIILETLRNRKMQL